MAGQDKLLQDKLLDAQAALLGAMLIDERTVGQALQEVTADDFVTPGYRTIFCAIQSIFGEGGHVDPVTVLARVPGLQQDVLVQLMDITPTAAHFQDYAAILRQEARLYRLREIAGRIEEAGDEAEARACVDEANALLVQRGQVLESGRRLCGLFPPARRQAGLSPVGDGPAGQADTGAARRHGDPGRVSIRRQDGAGAGAGARHGQDDARGLLQL